MGLGEGFVNLDIIVKNLLQTMFYIKESLHTKSRLGLILSRIKWRTDWLTRSGLMTGYCI